MIRVPSALRRYAPHLLCATAALTIFLVASDLFPYHSANHDEAVYLQQAAMLLEVQLTLQPPVEDAFRPWFFVERGDTLYPKYAPVPAAIFAIPLAMGFPRLALAGVAAAIVGLTYAITREVFDERTGLLAGALLLTSPLFVLDTATFLPYAPTTALNLGFAYAYLRAERDTTDHHRIRWAGLAGLCIGLAFFARPYTALLFAAPFIAHALWTLAREAGRVKRPHLSLTALQRRRGATATVGLLGVGLALTYNWATTGTPLVFPYQAFAPLDGLGFGYREILGHGVQYTPSLALTVNARVLSAYLLGWAPLGALGSILAATGVLATRDRWDWRRSLVAGVFVAVALGNIYFWGNLNILGAIETPGDGLISILGPYYHYDLLLPTSAFAARGLIWSATRIRTYIETTLESPFVRPALALVLVFTLVVSGAATTMAYEDPVSRNAGITAEYDRAYAPFTDGSGPPTQSVVFLPEPYGPWLNHPLQALRNDPGFEGTTVYALHENEFDVVDTYPDRRLYRYVYRGTWYPLDGSHVTATLQPLSVARGGTVRVDAALELPTDATSTSLRLSTTTDHGYYAAPVTGDVQELTLHVNESRAWVSGTGIEATNTPTITVQQRDTVVLVVNVNTEGDGFTYRLVLPVSTTEDGQRRTLTPELEVCTVPQLCGGASAYIPGNGGSPYAMNVTIRAS